ncbi:MAG: oligosaccharide flippase family protein [Pseudomonadota bacterium]
MTARPRSLGFDRLIRSGVWDASGQILQAAMTAVSLLVLVRILGPEVYGQFAICLIVAGLAGVLVEGHMADMLVQRDALDRRAIDATFTLILGFALLCTALMTGLSLPIAIFFNERELWPLIAVGASLPFLTAFSSVPVQLLIRRLQFPQLALMTLVSAAAAMMVGIGLAMSGAGVWSLLAMEAVRRFVMALAAADLANWTPRLSFERGALAEAFSFAVRRIENLGAKYVANILLPQTIIAQFLGTEALGLFTVARRLVEQMTMVLSSPVTSVTFSAASRLKETRNQLAKLVLGGIQVTTWVFWPALAGAIIVAPLAVPIFLGDDWTGSAMVFAVLCYAALRLPVMNFNEAIFKAKNELRVITWIELLGAALCFALILPGAVFAGLLGATAALAARDWLLWPIGAWYIRRETGVGLGQQLATLAWAGFPTLLMAMPLAFIAHLFQVSGVNAIIQLATLIPLGIVFYGAVWTLLNPDPARNFFKRAASGRETASQAPEGHWALLQNTAPSTSIVRPFRPRA